MAIHSLDYSGEPITEDQLRAFAPSIFTRTAHPDRSNKFAPICTWDAIEALSQEGFQVVSAQKQRCRTEARVPFVKHMLRLRHLSSTGLTKVGDTTPETILKNANDGTAAFDLMAGLFRLACLNGLILADQLFEGCKVRHVGDREHILDKVIGGTYGVIEQSQKALAAADAWSGVELEKAEQVAYAEAAHAVRWPVSKEGEPTTVISPEQLLGVRRPEDNKNDLWTVYNRVQENVMAGGLTNRTVNSAGLLRRSSSRRVKGIDSTVALNKALFTLANTVAEIRGVKISGN